MPASVRLSMLGYILNTSSHVPLKQRNPVLRSTIIELPSSASCNNQCGKSLRNVGSIGRYIEYTRYLYFMWSPFSYETWRGGVEECTGGNCRAVFESEPTSYRLLIGYYSYSHPTSCHSEFLQPFP